MIFLNDKQFHLRRLRRRSTTHRLRRLQQLELQRSPRADNFVMPQFPKLSLCNVAQNCENI
jgi:hypothetical protein